MRYTQNSIFKGLNKDSQLVWYAKWGIYLFLRKTGNLSSVLRQFVLKRKKCQVLLINPDKYDKSVRNIPIGLACIASYLEKHGISVRILDSWFLPKWSKLLKLVISLAKPEVIGISIANTVQAHNAYETGSFVKKYFPKINVVYGGLHAAYLPGEPFEKGSADYVVLGEGEIPFLQLVQALKQKSDVKKINGVVYKKDGLIIKNEKRQILDLNKAPFPAYHLLDMKSYDTDIHVLPYAKERAVDIMTSRGCINNCAYCGSPFLYKRKVRFKNPKLMIKEVEHLRNRYDLQYFHFHDDDFLLDPKRIENFCDLLIEKNYGVKWLCLTNVNTLLKQQALLKKMKRAGCVTIEFGIETVDKNILKKINKAQRTNELIGLSKTLKKQGIVPQYLIMSFNPGETLDTAYKTAQLIYSLNHKKNPPVVPYLVPHHHNFVLGFLTTPYPGSRLYKSAYEEGIVLTRTWDDYYPERVNFIPYSFLKDIPEKTKNLQKDNFLKNILDYKEAIQGHRINGYKIYPCLEDFESYSEFLYGLYSMCDSEKNVEEVYQKIFKQDNKTRLEHVCVGLRFLAMFGLIKSKG